jgi:hypothetical protein
VGLTGTLPLKWIYQIHWILFGRPGLEWRGAHSEARVPARLPGENAVQVSTSGELPAGSGWRRCYDGDQRGVGNSGAWSSSRFASNRGGERWPEVRRAEMDFGR